jgi:hypothetical protein
MILATGLACSPAGEEGPNNLKTSSFVVPGEIVSIVGDPLAPGVPMSEVLDHPDAFERAQRVSQILQRSKPEDLEGLMYDFEAATLERGDLEYGLFAHWWARFDPQAAFIYSDTALRTDHGGVILQVVRAWAADDPIGAIESRLLVSRDTQTPGIRDALIDVFVIAWHEGGSPGLKEWILTQQDPRSIATGLRAYGRMKVFELGPEAALEWSRTADFSEADRRLVIAGMLNIIAHKYPEMAVDWIAVAKEDGVDTRTFASRIARSWAHHNPEKAMEWVIAEVDNEYDRSQAVMQITRRWLRRDAPGMQKWLDGHVGEKWTDLMRNQSVRWYVRKNHYQIDWNLALQKTLEITDDNFAHGMAAWVLQRYFVADPEGSEVWLIANPDAVPEAFVERARKISPADRQEVEEALAHYKDDRSDKS